MINVAMDVSKHGNGFRYRLHKMKGKSTNKKFKGEEGGRLGKGL